MDFVCLVTNDIPLEVSRRRVSNIVSVFGGDGRRRGGLPRSKCYQLKKVQKFVRFCHKLLSVEILTTNRTIFVYILKNFEGALE